jgi:hypothetical protein
MLRIRRAGRVRGDGAGTEVSVPALVSDSRMSSLQNVEGIVKVLTARKNEPYPLAAA